MVVVEHFWKILRKHKHIVLAILYVNLKFGIELSTNITRTAVCEIFSLFFSGIHLFVQISQEFVGRRKRSVEYSIIRNKKNQCSL